MMRVLVVATFAGALFANVAWANAMTARKSAIGSIEATVEKQSKSEFVVAVERFATERGFSIRVASTSRDGDHISIQMIRSDIMIISVNTAEIESFSTFFYDNSNSVPRKIVRDLLSAFETEIAKVKGVKVVKSSVKSP